MTDEERAALAQQLLEEDNTSLAGTFERFVTPETFDVQAWKRSCA